MTHHAPIERLVDLLDPQANLLFNVSLEEAKRRVARGDAEAVRQIDGQFAFVEKDGITVRMARSIGRPMRYFLAKRVEGPCLIVAERMEEIATYLEREGLRDQFHPSYTRMVPAHHIMTLRLVGCPDPNPTLTRFLNPQPDRWSTDLDELGQRYIGAVAESIERWLDQVDSQEPMGVLFSGGIDSGAVFLTLYHALLKRGQSPARLKAFTLSVEGAGADLEQAKRFLETLDLGLFLEVFDVSRDAICYRDAIAATEDYKPLDVQAATMALALCRAIRQRYPAWKYLIDGDGGDENLKDYAIEENSELTIRSVLGNRLRYHEGWGVDAVKHSLTYSGGQSRGHVRTYMPARQLGFVGFSPYALPNVIEVAEGIPFVALTDWQPARLYALKGEIIRRGIAWLTGWNMPIYPKRRFQRGAVDDQRFTQLFPKEERAYRRVFAELYG